eukprot:CAMPEP_0169293070 /NCGR_PEP_ID=MMETSP1016-20121227/63082_1 /TAXON_ID=342587 /ORGANISM="Karlodinium micrum, Strain CCMP2283" /LENGTH=130 /DNA_ID=CAMNT_0009383713 /DNA_START=190 /DNA_END=579 /DNA_ORIENTATION=+
MPFATTITFTTTVFACMSIPVIVPFLPRLRGFALTTFITLSISFTTLSTSVFSSTIFSSTFVITISLGLVVLLLSIPPPLATAFLTAFRVTISIRPIISFCLVAISTSASLLTVLATSSFAAFAFIARLL